MFRFSIIFIVLLYFSYNLIAQNDTTKMFIFGHSLIDHRPPAIATPSDETTVPHWIYLLSEEAGYNYAAGGQYGFLPQHANLPPISQWGYDTIPGVWESDTEPYSAADIKTVMITAGNFIQWQGPNVEYVTDPGVTPINATEDIIDWVDAEEDSVRFYIYENWPDMAPYLNAGFPPSDSEFSDYNDFTLGDFHDWWLEYHDSLILSRPELNVRMIPVGPILSKIFTELIPLQIPYTELYEDDAPHGRASLYFLAGAITYMGIYEEKIPSTYVPDTIVHQVIQDSLSQIIEFAWNELLEFDDSNGNNRVFQSGDLTNLVDLQLSEDCIQVFPNPSSDYFQIFGNLEDFNIDILDSKGAVHQNINANTSLKCIIIDSLPTGTFYVKASNKTNSDYCIQKIIKSN